MTTKQRIIFYSLCTAIALVDGLLMPWYSMSKTILCASIIPGTFVACIALGELKGKWKRDKEMAHIVADRLLGKPKTLEIIAGNMVNQAGMLAGMLGGSGAGAMQGAMGNSCSAQSLLGLPTSSHGVTPGDIGS